MECEAIWIRDIDQQKGGHKKTGDLGSVDLEKNGEDLLERTYNKCRSADKF